LLGFGITFYSFWLTWREQKRTRDAVRQAIERAAYSMLNTVTDEVERLLFDFKDAVRSRLWKRAGEKCDEAESRTARIVDHPHVESDENNALAVGIDDLRLVSRYITTHKVLKQSSEGFHDPKMDAVDKLIAALRRIRTRIGNKVWEV
jgi:hypothetical protein